METVLLEDADQVHSRTARAAVTIPHYLVEQQTKFSAIIQGNHGQTVDGMPMYLHGQPATVKRKEHMYTDTCTTHTHVRAHTHTHIHTHTHTHTHTHRYTHAHTHHLYDT